MLKSNRGSHLVFSNFEIPKTDWIFAQQTTSWSRPFLPRLSLHTFCANFILYLFLLSTPSTILIYLFHILLPYSHVVFTFDFFSPSRFPRCVLPLFNYCCCWLKPFTKYTFFINFFQTIAIFFSYFFLSPAFVFFAYFTPLLQTSFILFSFLFFGFWFYQTEF